MADETADRLAIHELLALYGHILDDLAHDRYLEIFTPDVVFDLSAYGRAGFTSAAEVAENFRGRNMFAHHTTNVVVERLDGDVAEVRSKFFAFENAGGIRTGDYFDTVVRTPEGWRISSRRSVPREPRVFAEQASQAE